MAYTTEQIEKAKQDIEKMTHYEMCSMWRFSPLNIYLDNTGVAVEFKKRLFEHFGGFTPEISKSLSDGYINN